MRNTLYLLATFLLLLPASARTQRKQDYSLLLAPSLHGAVQISRDIEHRENVLLMSYDPESPDDMPFLHAWRSNAWLHVSPERFAEGTFVQSPPNRVIIVGPPSPLVESLVDQASGWAGREVLNIESLDPAEMINTLGRLFEFSPREWRWYADRYELEIEDLNRDTRHVSWYDTYRASDLPPPTSPFQNRRRDTDPEPGLRPIIRVEDLPDEPHDSDSPPREERETPPVREDDDEGFSFDDLH